MCITSIIHIQTFYDTSYHIFPEKLLKETCVLHNIVVNHNVLEGSSDTAVTISLRLVDDKSSPGYEILNTYAY